MTYIVTCCGTPYIFLMLVLAEEVLVVGPAGIGGALAVFFALVYAHRVDWLHFVDNGVFSVN